MKAIFQALVVNVLLFTIFALLYALLPENHFTCSQTNYTPRFIDYLGLSITTQAGVGISILTPASDTSKILLIIQQFFIISFNIILLYLFSEFKRK
jgi:hypothetical protein